MVIRGYIEADSPLVNCGVTFSAFPTRPRLRVTFLIDTGATLSVLHPRDALRLVVDLASIASDPRSKLAAVMGGTGRFLETTTLLDFDDEVPREHPLRHVLGIAEPTRANERLPSILGMDFIQHFRLTLSVRKDRVELEPLFDDA